jgi:RHS repeat-associated protein
MSSPQQVLNCRYRYDPLDRLTSHTQSDTPERHRFYCKSRLATEVQGAVGHSIVQQGDLLLAQHKRQNGVLDSTLLATDLQRSVLNTLKSGRQPQPIAYSPYGHHPAESGLSSLLGFNGERPDPVTGHYLLGNGYRAFNPVLMKFNSPDSLSPFGKGGLNTYMYCLGDPLNQTDPTGHNSVYLWVTRPIRALSPSFKKWQLKKAINKLNKIENNFSNKIESLINDMLPSEIARARAAQKANPPKNVQKLTTLAAKKIPDEKLQKFLADYAIPKETSADIESVIQPESAIKSLSNLKRELYDPKLKRYTDNNMKNYYLFEQEDDAQRLATRHLLTNPVLTSIRKDLSRSVNKIHYITYG